MLPSPRIAVTRGGAGASGGGSAAIYEDHSLAAEVKLMLMQMDRRLDAMESTMTQLGAAQHMVQLPTAPPVMQPFSQPQSSGSGSGRSSGRGQAGPPMSPSPRASMTPPLTPRGVHA